jgi:hypothetical protein
VKQRIGTERYNWMREKKQKTWNMGLKYFEEFVKRNYNEEEHAEINIPFPGLPDNEEAGLDSGFLIMSADQVKEIFEPVVEEVINLVEGQVQSIRQNGGLVCGIVLVGGFGQSNYLYNRMKAHYNMAPPPPYTVRPTHAVALSSPQSVEIYHPIHAWTAVVRGAVLRGLEGSMVVSRRSRWHYGTSYATVFDEAKHPISDRYWSPLWERWMVSDRMQFHIAKARISQLIGLPVLTRIRVLKSQNPLPYRSTTHATSVLDSLSSSKTTSSHAMLKTRQTPSAKDSSMCARSQRI